MTQNSGRYAVQGHLRSPIERLYATSYWRLVLSTYIAPFPSLLVKFALSTWVGVPL